MVNEELLKGFKETAQIYDDLINEGHFGTEAIEWKELRDNTTNKEYFEAQLMDWAKNPQTKFLREINISEQLLKIYTDAYIANPNETIQVLETSFYGNSENPNLEIFSAYMSAGEDFQTLKLNLTDAQSKPLSLAKKTSLYKEVAGNYHKQVELIAKQLTYVIAFKKIAVGENYNLNSLHDKTIYQKEELLKAFDSQLLENLLGNAWSRAIRNGVAHLDLMPIINRSEYIIKKKNKKITISFEDMFSQYLLGATAFNRMVNHTGMLFYLMLHDPSYLIKITDAISVGLNKPELYES